MSREARVVRYHADALDVIPTLADESVDAVVTDPPYELGFMGRAWDASGIAYNVELWKQCFRVLKPGGHLLAFGGTRTSHRLAVAVEDAGFEIRDSIVWIYGSGFPKSLDVSKAIDKAAGAQREVVGSKLGLPGYSLAPSNMDHRTYGRGLGNTSDPEAECAVTAPATDDAKRWAGWGTALKPSHEPVICAMKPHTLQQILDTIGSRIGRLEGLWRAPAAGPTIPTGAGGASFGPMVTWPFGSGEPTGWSIVSSWRNCWADLCSQLSTSTIATTSNLTTDLKTLCSLLERITHASTTPDQMAADGLRSLVTAADNLFAVAVLSSRATLALSAIESVTAGMPTSRQGAAELVSEPIVVARKPLVGTVAANVLAHGTGALNIDACRVASAESLVRPAILRIDNEVLGKGLGVGVQVEPEGGRWPANVVLDEGAAAELDEQSGTTKSGVQVKPVGKGGIWSTLPGEAPAGPQYGDTGGASRFFPVFRYQAKAPTRERPKYWRPSCNCETVKPWQGQSPQRVIGGSGSDAGRSWSTSTSGSESTAGQSPPDTTSTIETATNSTMLLETFSSSQSSSTSASIPAASFATTAGGSPAPSVDDSSRSVSSIGTSRPKAGRSTVAADPATLSEWSEISVCANCGAPAVREAHSTVKPLELMRWLVRLVTQPDGVVLEPFAGSGTTVEACVLEGMRCLAIEREESYLPLIAERMARAGLVAW